MPDFLDDFLEPRPQAKAGDALRNVLRARTTRVIRWRRRARHAAVAAILLLAYGAGLGTMRLVAPTETPRETQIDVAHAAPPVDRQVVQPSLATAPPDRPVDNERLAAQQPERRAELLRRAGDMYLADESDPSAALRCYTQALNAGGVAALEYADSDSWLVMAIKDARRKEKSNEQ
jgi:hypothetical protein